MPSRNDKRSGSTRRGAGRPKTTTPSSSSSPADPERTPMQPRRSTKRGKPAFDVVSDAVEDTRTGWVYRSEGAPRLVIAAAVTPPRFSAGPAPKARPRLEAEPAPAAQLSFGWIAGAMA